MFRNLKECFFLLHVHCNLLNTAPLWCRWSVCASVPRKTVSNLCYDHCVCEHSPAERSEALATIRSWTASLCPPADPSSTASSISWRRRRRSVTAFGTRRVSIMGGVSSRTWQKERRIFQTPKDRLKILTKCGFSPVYSLAPLPV